MPTLGRDFLQALTNPPINQGLFNLGSAVGGMPGRYKAQKKEESFNALMQQGQAAVAQKDPNTLLLLSNQLSSLGYPQESAALSKTAMQLQEQKKIIEAGSGMFSETPEQVMGSVQQLIALGRFEEAEQALKRAESLTEREQTVGRQRTSAQMLISELQGIMETPNISKANKEKALGLLREAAKAGEDSDLLQPRVEELKKSLLPVKTGSRAAPVFKDLMRPNPNTGVMEKRTISFTTDPITGAVTEEDVGLTPPKEFAPREEKGLGSIPAPVEKRMIKMSEESTKAGILLSRNRGLRDSLNAENPKTTGLLSDFRTSILNLAGMRDKEEEDKTAYLKNKNTDMIEGLPPGVASDRDIEIFSQGFPEAKASRGEILRYLAAEERILAAQQDMTIVFEQHLQSQVEDGRDGSIVGYESKRQAYGTYMSKTLNKMEKEKEENPEKTIEIENRYAKQMYSDLGFVPTFYR
tara:strand:- start:2853 stop:4253 length:1401 start_codon:yes stop_codon:yes gene_type:complete